jgi:hypothetical protein
MNWKDRGRKQSCPIEVLTRHMPRGTEYSWCSGRELNQASSEYEYSVTTTPTRENVGHTKCMVISSRRTNVVGDRSYCR